MKNFHDTALWAMIHTAETATGEAMLAKWESALGDFEKEVWEYCHDEHNLADRTRELQSRHSEIDAILKEPALMERTNGVHYFLERAMKCLDCELDIVKMELDHADRFAAPSGPAEVPNFDLYLAEKPNKLGIVGIGEVAYTLWLSKEIVGADGKPAPLIRIANAFEYFLHMKFGEIYRQEEALFRRKAYNRTKALDYLRALLIREDKRRLGEKEKKKKEDEK